jgi:hypothetical protein
VGAGDDRGQALDELVGGQYEVRGAVKARCLEGELDSAIFEESQPVVADRGASAVAKELLEPIAGVAGNAYGCMEVEALELRVMTQGLVEPRCALGAPVSAERDGARRRPPMATVPPITHPERASLSYSANSESKCCDDSATRERPSVAHADRSSI